MDKEAAVSADDMLKSVAEIEPLIRKLAAETNVNDTWRCPLQRHCGISVVTACFDLDRVVAWNWTRSQHFAS